MLRAIYLCVVFIYVCMNFFEMLHVENLLFGAEMVYSVLAVMTNGSTMIVRIILLLLQTLWPVDFVLHLSCCR
jgi:hypothetical protein